MYDIELRQCIQSTSHGSKTVLQYRKYINTAAYAGFVAPSFGASDMQWTEWFDVPTVNQAE